ncbi:DUF1810 domain-containing protein [Paraburkholderia sp. Tr-20389]|uniref:DUF1810 domain-containing protein n=1 Tax=Paraburkholderia sp. Tr-20389 TaxID=2703903 RepID=UPI00197CF1DD|nr:DUF1810 domain-containing protein [Paraburkholderia sp. Tr-20389]MBN3755004.1 DUF1810 domain-containing protein [Paraburkholderia sp. Tr-20389]
MNDQFDLRRFVDAQAPIFETALAELRAGRKQSHWMWYVFPQFQGLGESQMAQKFAIQSLDEAVSYLQHPVLGPRLREVTRAVNEVEGRSIETIFGYPDYLKFRSSMTLFSKAAPDEPLFTQALAKYFGGAADERTLALL